MILVVLLGWTVAMLIASILAYRGRRYWATRLMLIGGTLQILGVAGYVVLMLISFGFIGGGFGRGPSSAAMITMAVMGLMIPVGMVLQGIGVLGLCARYGALEKRAEQLELLNLQLQERLTE